MNKIPYGKIFTTLAPMHEQLCWNLSDTYFDIPAGTRVKVERECDSASTTICLVDENDKAVAHPEHQYAYRFAASNSTLGTALGMEFPAQTEDLVGNIIRYEDGEMDEEEAREFLTNLRDSGLGSHLQGSYGRAIAAL